MIVANLKDFIVASSSVMYATCDISYVDAGIWTNTTHQFLDVPTPTFITGLTVNSAIRSKIATYTNTLNGGSATALDVVLGGAFALPVL